MSVSLSFCIILEMWRYLWGQTDIFFNMRTKNNSSVMRKLNNLKTLALCSIYFNIRFEDTTGDIKTDENQFR
jgi:hypothetical protein